MGTDIHAAIEFKGNGNWQALLFPNKYYGLPGWEEEPEKSASLDITRNYRLFSILGNVRNGYGFAGCDTGDGFVPMSDHRGTPEDVSSEAEAALSGEHSPSWVTLREILEYDWTNTVKHHGWVNGPALEEFDRRSLFMKFPSQYSGSVAGPNVSHISCQELRDKITAIPQEEGREGWQKRLVLIQETLSQTYCQLEWETTYADCTQEFLVEVLPQMLKLGTKFGYENVRLVMDFDS